MSIKDRKYFDCGECLELVAFGVHRPGEITRCRSCGADNIVPEKDVIRGEIAKNEHNHVLLAGKLPRGNREEIFNQFWKFLMVLINCHLLLMALVFRRDLGLAGFLEPVFGTDSIFWRLIVILYIPFFLFVAGMSDTLSTR